jgi:hypothetical protein
VIGFRSRPKVQPTDQQDAAERRQMRSDQIVARALLADGDTRIKQLRAHVEQVVR